MKLKKLSPKGRKNNSQEIINEENNLPMIEKKQSLRKNIINEENLRMFNNFYESSSEEDDLICQKSPSEKSIIHSDLYPNMIPEIMEKYKEDIIKARSISHVKLSEKI